MTCGKGRAHPGQPLAIQLVAHLAHTELGSKTSSLKGLVKYLGPYRAFAEEGRQRVSTPGRHGPGLRILGNPMLRVSGPGGDGSTRSVAKVDDSGVVDVGRHDEWMMSNVLRMQQGFKSPVEFGNFLIDTLRTLNTHGLRRLLQALVTFRISSILRSM